MEAKWGAWKTCVRLILLIWAQRSLCLQMVRIPLTESGAGLVPEARLFVLVTHLADFWSPGRGVVLGRAAITLRSLETQGCFGGAVGQRKKASDKKRQNLKSLAADFTKLCRRDYLMRMVTIMHKDHV